MLRQRVITALVLLAILLPALFYPSTVPFAAVVLVLMAAAAWEWGRLNGLGAGPSVLLGGVCTVLCGATWLLGGLHLDWSVAWLLGGAAWVLASASLLRSGVAGWPRWPLMLRLILGVAVLWLAWLAAVQARLIGINFLLSTLLLVWAADICAYFAGRAFGLKFTQGRLAPSISPGKSWEGVWGALLGVCLMAVVWVYADSRWAASVPSLYTRMASAGWWMLALGTVFLVAMSVVGDLVESLIKRSAGVKDSSGLLPGHGGVLDRVDALLPALPLAMMLSSWTTR